MSQAQTLMPPLPDYYEILQVHPKASPAVIKKAYRTLLMELGNHPDMGGDPAVAARMTEAYQVLGDPLRRAEYDQAYFANAAPGAPAPRAPAPERATPPRAATPASNLVVLCPRCRTKNRVRSQEVLDIAKCSKCGQKLSSLPNAMAEWAERLREQATRMRGDVRAAWTEHRAYKVTHRTQPVKGNQTAWAAERLLSVGVPLLLLAASGGVIWWAYSTEPMAGDPIKAAEILQAEDRPDLAQQVLHRAIERGDTNPRVQEKLGETYLAQKDFDSAAYHFGQAALRNPDNAFVQAQQGRAFYLRGHLDKAEIAYKQALQIDSSYAPALSDLGRIHAKRQRYRDAAIYFERAVRIEPTADVYYNLGLVRKADAQDQPAMNAFKQALREDPNHRASMVQLGEILASSGQLEQAAAQYLTASQIRHEDLDLHLKLATIYEKTGHKGLAIKEWNVCLAQGRDNPLIAERARRALDKLGANPQS